MTMIAAGKAFIATCFVVLSAVASADAQTAVAPKTDWSTKIVKLGNGEAEVQFIAKIPPGWHIYSQNVSSDGPMPTTISIDPNSSGIQVIGPPAEPSAKTKFEPAFEVTVAYFEKEAIFTQKIKYTEGQPAQVKATVEYMMCNDGGCLPPDELKLVVPVN